MPFPSPQPGPLETTKDLINGDYVRFIDETICRVSTILDDWRFKVHEREGIFPPDMFSFVGRPDLDGWIDWSGGENPVPGRWVEFETRGVGQQEFRHQKSDALAWGHKEVPPIAEIIRFRLVEAPATPEKVLVDDDGNIGRAGVDSGLRIEPVSADEVRVTISSATVFEQANLPPPNYSLQGFGKLKWNGQQYEFEGDPHESAKVFAQHLLGVVNRPADIAKLVNAARRVTLEDRGIEALGELDAALTPFADVPWEDK